MPRTYKGKLGHRQYVSYTNAVLDNAICDIVDRGLSIRQAAEKYGIPRKTLGHKIQGKHIKQPGGQTCLSALEQILVCADWGMPLSSLDIRIIAKDYLSRAGRVCVKFQNNLPGEDWLSHF